MTDEPRQEQDGSRKHSVDRRAVMKMIVLVFLVFFYATVVVLFLRWGFVIFMAVPFELPLLWGLLRVNEPDPLRRKRIRTLYLLQMVFEASIIGLLVPLVANEDVVARPLKQWFFQVTGFNLLVGLIVYLGIIGGLWIISGVLYNHFEEKWGLKGIVKGPLGGWW